MIDLNEVGPCSTRYCQNIGRRARGARDIAPLAERTKEVIHKSFYCEPCVAAAGQRSLSPSIAETARRRNAQR